MDRFRPLNLVSAARGPIRRRTASLTGDLRKIGPQERKQIVKRILTAALAGIVLTICAACSDAPQQSSASPEDLAGQDVKTAVEPVNGPQYFTDFSAETVRGEACTQNVFSGRDLSLVSVSATWCGPCVAELPELEELYTEGDTGVAVIFLDTADDADAVETAQYITDQLALTFPVLIPGSAGFNGLDATIQAYPTAYFVNDAGAIVGGPYVGSRSLEDWKELISEVKGAAS